MIQLTYTQASNPGRLYAELLAAIPSLAPSGSPPVAKLLISSNGTALRLTVPDGINPALIDPVLAEHDPTPSVTKHDYREITAEIQTSDALGQSRTLLTAPLELATGYTAEILVFGVGAAAPFDRYTMRASVDAARLGGNAILDGQSAYQGYPRKSNAAAWTTVAAVAAVSGANFLINVTGQAGITINWQALVKFYRFNQTGLIG